MQLAAAGFLAIFAFIPHVLAFIDKYDTSNAPYDVRIIKNFVGYWQLRGIRGSTPRVIPPPDVIDIGVNPLPKFGSRALNITMHWFENGNAARLYKTDYGFIPVKNATKFDPRWHVALLTTSSDGYSLMEQGLVLNGPQIRTHLKQFVSRSFDMGGLNREMKIDALERLFRLKGSRDMDMTIQSVTNHGNDDYTADYFRTLPAFG